MAEKKKLSKEEIVEGFNKLRQEQRSIASKIAELDADSMEHNLVIEALSEVCVFECIVFKHVNRVGIGSF